MFFLLARLFIKRPLRIITLPCLWVVIEFLKENVWCGFSWANLGYSQHSNLYLIQIADLGGVKLISFLIVMVNVLIWELIFERRCLSKFNVAKKIVFVFLVILACFLYSFFRLNSLSKTDSVKVSVIQPNIVQELRWQEFMIPHIIETLKNLREEANSDSLVIFPESSWPVIIGEDNFEEVKDFVRKGKKETLLGAIKEDNYHFYNTAILLSSEGEVRDIYCKIKLVPFGEYVPLRKFLSFIEIVNSVGDMSYGKESTVFSYQDKKFSVLICFEDIFPVHVLKFAQKSDFLINITNDAWFKGEPEASQHLAIMTLRAVENRISIVRCANTGISGWVSFKGEINKLKKGDKEVFFADTGDFNIALNKKRSFYNRYGEVFVVGCIIFLVGFGLHNRVCKIPGGKA